LEKLLDTTRSITIAKYVQNNWNSWQIKSVVCLKIHQQKMHADWRSNLPAKRQEAFCPTC